MAVLGALALDSCVLSESKEKIDVNKKLLKNFRREVISMKFTFAQIKKVIIYKVIIKA